MKFVTMKTLVSQLEPGDRVYDPMGKYKLPKKVLSVKGSTVRLQNGPRSIWITAQAFDRVVQNVSDVIR